jgi:DNA topoisomerase-1
MFKRAGRGRNKPFCINEACANFLPEDKRGYYKKKTEETGEQPAVDTEKPAKKTTKKPAAKKTATKKATKKKGK